MVQLRLHPRREQRVLLAACTTTARTAAPVRPEPGIAAQVMFDLRADDARDTSFAAAHALLAVPLHDPADNAQPLAETLAEAEEVRAERDAACRALFDEDRRRREDIAAAAWIDEAIGAELAEHCAAVLDAVAGRPELRHDTSLLMALAPIVAQLKGLVA